MSMNFKQTVNYFMTLGWDLNQATSLAMGNPPNGPEKQQAQPVYNPPPPPAPPKPALQTGATQASAGQSTRRPKKSKKATSLSDLRIERPTTVNEQVAVGSGGTGLTYGGIG